ncbi:MAG: PhzF family phenazine biosynthesis protein [Cloacibacterium sp.]|uniref:PhzF family phenazine biosynthesis protein n=1 Tax=Cloacibacterium sp. TaxID=1913682 RepID=UPI003C70905E
MSQKIYQIDAFADALFSGNPAAVCPLDSWLDTDIMQKIAAENNLAETAFTVPVENGFEIRWFTPEVEVDLCGHATLASAYTMINFEGFSGEKINFFSRNSGTLTVNKNGDFLTLDFPVDNLQKVEDLAIFEKCFAYQPIEAYQGKTDYLLVFENEHQIQNIEPNIPEIAKINARGIIVSSISENFDFVSRFFGPNCGVNEDPVTGSAHTTLTPFWAEKLGKTKLTAKQISKRGGVLECELKNDRVLISGKCKTYLKGEIFIK